MKTILRSLFLTACLCSISARATLYTETFNSVNAGIPDGNPLGVSLSGIVSDIPAGWTVSGLTVTLNLSGGYNGDLYSYLVNPAGVRVLLMNQPGVAINGFGAGGSGLNVTLQDGASQHGNIQDEISNASLSGTYNAAESLGGFNGSVASGTWTLFFADLSNGGGQSALNSWSLNIEAVPEPANVALGIFLGLIAVAKLRSLVFRTMVNSRK